MTLYIAFLIISVVFIATPGPNVLAVVSTGFRHGRLRALQTVVGTTLAMSIQLAVAAMGTVWFVHAFSGGYRILKWAGIAYLLLLGVRHIKKSFSSHQAPAQISALASVFTGFAVSLSNPKTILFFSAFLPQFVESRAHYQYEIVILSVSFLGIAVLIDSSYAILSARAGRLLAGNRVAALHERLTGLLYVAAGLWLAISRRTQ
jgi:threonine/homoserine/homoserine lactone efflux protein